MKWGLHSPVTEKNGYFTIRTYLFILSSNVYLMILVFDLFWTLDGRTCPKATSYIHPSTGPDVVTMKYNWTVIFYPAEILSHY